MIEVGEQTEREIESAGVASVPVNLPPIRAVRPRAGARLIRLAGRYFSLCFLLPLQYLWNVLSYVYGLAFLLTFCLGFLKSPELEGMRLVALLQSAVQPLLTAAGQLLASLGVISPDAYQALPLLLSVVTWLARPWFLTRLKLIRSRLERPAGDYFQPRKRKSSPLTTVPGVARSLQENEFGPVESSARLIQTGPLPTVARRYELLEEIGRGPVGAVYKALDLQLGRFVAVKMIFIDALSPDQLQQQKERLYREARTAGKMQHPGIATIHDLDEDESGTPFIAMEYADFRGLDQAIEHAAEPPTLKERLAVAIQVSRALDYAHRRGIVHRDIKPSNILITGDGRAKIGDFGIAKPIDRDTAEVSGTPAFVAPELMEGAPASARTDIFSLGVVLYWLFTEKMPFTGRTLTEIIYNVAHLEPLSARQVNWALPAELEPVLRRCMAKNPAERYETAGKLAADLIAVRRAQRKKRRTANPQETASNTTPMRPQPKRAAS